MCEGNLEKSLGMVNAKQALAKIVQGEEPDYAKLLHPALYVPETLTGMELLDQFRASNMQMAFVIDEYGEIQGLVTLQDVLEAVTGEFPPITSRMPGPYNAKMAPGYSMAPFHCPK